MGRRPRRLPRWLEHDLLPLLNFCVLMIPIVLGAREVASRLAFDVSHEHAPAAAAAAPTPTETPPQTNPETPSETPLPSEQARPLAGPLLGYGP